VFDLVIRNGTVIDGSGNDAVHAAVAVRAGRIAMVGVVHERGAEEIDARGMLVTPGFVDIHTHYDGQVTWEERVEPSSAHGVTTVVMGNCGVGFAPCRSQDQATLIRLMEGVEDIPGSALAEGLPWSWESFGEYLDAVDAIRHDIDVATLLPHGAARVFVMGDRGVRREPATERDIDALRRVARDAVAAGALGFSTSRTMLHSTADGDPTPMLGAAERELVAMAKGVREAGGGVFEMVSDFLDAPQELKLIRAVAEQVDAVSFSLLQSKLAPLLWRELLTATDDALADGLCVRAQVLPRPVGILMGLDATLHPFMTHPTYVRLSELPRAERLERLRQPDIRQALLAESAEHTHPFFRAFGHQYERYFPLGDPPCYEPTDHSSVAASAARQAKAPLEVALDVLLERDGRGLLLFPFANYEDGNLDAVREMMVHPNALFGLGDGGAHVGIISDASATTSSLAYWGRDRPHGRLPIPWLVSFLTHRNAAHVGLHDRGLLRPGMKADLNVIDLDALAVASPRVQQDLPAGGRRFLQDASGYVATIVNGTVIRRNGESTGALPGELLRGRRRAPPLQSEGTAELQRSQAS